jgi:predicted thioesterase
MEFNFTQGVLDMKKMIAIALMSGLLASPAWALFESNKQLAATATVTLEDAVKHALKAVPGKAVEAEIGKEDGRTVYEIEIVDSNNKTQKVYVDAQSGQAKIDH